MNKSDKNKHLIQWNKESPKARKARASSGIKLRATVFEDKKRREEEKNKSTRQLLEEC